MKISNRHIRGVRLAPLLTALFVVQSVFISGIQVAYADDPCTKDNSGSVIDPTACQQQLFRQGILYFDVLDGTCNTADDGSASLLGSDKQSKAFNYFVSQGLSAVQSAGIVGNLISESAGTMDPRIVQGGSKADSPTPNVGYGLAQWTSTGRQQNLEDFAAKENLPVYNMKLQLDFIWHELSNDYKASSLTPLQSATTPRDAAVIILVNYEAPADHDPNGPNADARTQHAVDVLRLYGNGQGSSTSTSPVATGVVSSGGTSTSGSNSSCSGSTASSINTSDTTAIAGKGFIGNCGGKGSTAPIVCGQCVNYVEWALNAHADHSKGPYNVLTDQSGPGYHKAETVTKNLGGKGFTVNSTPAVHATFTIPAAALGNTYGHTGIVSQVNTDANGAVTSIVVEQSNWPSGEKYGQMTISEAKIKSWQMKFAHTEVGWK